MARSSRARVNAVPAKQTLLVTGAAGYLGKRVVALAQEDARVGRILALDAALPSYPTARHTRWIHARLEDPAQWEDVVRKEEPHAIIHAAWQVRIPYGKEAHTRAVNLSATRAVARVALTLPSVRAFVFVSSAAVFGAFPTNHPEYAFCEADEPREDEYPYAAQKREAEVMLRNLWQQEGVRAPLLRIARPVSIVGPEGRKRAQAFALTALLAGLARPSAHWVGRIAQRAVSVFPAPSTWRRQYVHEDDAARALLTLALEAGSGGATAPVAIYHLAPPGGAIGPQAFARATGKPWVPVAPFLVRLAFWGAWHLSRGAVPTCRGVWRFYSYPIVLEGTRITRDFSFRYRWNSPDALAAMLEGNDKEEAGRADNRSDDAAPTI